MGKPYNHQYFFSGSGCSAGTMICAHCNQPIFDHAHDWMNYTKDLGDDWAFVCFHRRCRTDQTGWEKIETAYLAAAKLETDVRAALTEICAKFKVNDDYLVSVLTDDEE